MANTYVELDVSAFEKFLQAKGFQRTEQLNEVVYIKRHEKFNPLVVKVFTTIRVNSDAAHSYGKDAIRVVAIFDNGKWTAGIGKFPRVFRSAPPGLSEEERQEYLRQKVLQRMRDAYIRCNEWRKEKLAQHNKSGPKNG